MTHKPNNVIPFDKNRKKKKSAEEAFKPARKSASKVIDLSERRLEQIAAEKRTVARTVLSHFLGVFIVLPKKGLQPVVLYDISEAGLSFDIPTEVGSYNIAESITMRIYLSHETYFSFAVKIANKRVAEEEGVVRHGAIFKKDDESFRTLFYFTKFLENVSFVAKKDSGDRLLGRID